MSKISNNTPTSPSVQRSTPSIQRSPSASTQSAGHASSASTLARNTFEGAAKSPVSVLGTVSSIAELANHNRSARLGAALNGAKVATGLVGSAKSTAGAIGDVKKAIQTGNPDDINKAVGSVANAGSTILGTANAALKGANVGNIYRQAYQAAKGAGATGQLARSAAKAATRQALGGASRQVVRSAARKAVTEAARKGLSRSAARALGKAAGNAAGTAARRAATSGLAKAAGRFAPGLNVAIAGLDAAQAIAIQRDPNASTAKKAAAWVTAGASALAATNIPIVSQAGAVVSTVSGFLRDLW